MRDYKKIIYPFVILSALVTTGCRGGGRDVSPDVVVRSDYTSVYEKIGNGVTMDEVEEDVNGLAYLQRDGIKYELGMDFLSKAMVYNVTPCGDFKDATQVYNEWWRLYIQRWNRLAPEVPLYSNQYYDVYDGRIENFKTTPYFDAADAIVGATLSSGDSVVLGNVTTLSGQFRDAAFGKANAGAGDADVQSLTSGYATVYTDANGALNWADGQVLSHRMEVENADGSKTFLMQIREGLLFSDGTPIRAEDYLVAALVGCTPVMAEAGGNFNAGVNFVGYEEFNAYTGTGNPVPFSGIRLLDEYTFSVTVKAEYADYYYALSYGGFTPQPTALYLGEYRVRDDGQGCYLEQGFYERSTSHGVGSYVFAQTLRRNLTDPMADFPYSGPYTVKSYDAASKVATLERNAYFQGDYRGVPSIERISYAPVVAETQLDQLKKGRVDVLSGITGGAETKAALALVADPAYKFRETHYDRAGYGKLAFRCDFSPTQFAEVRRAVMHTIDRDEFAQTFTGGYGSVVDGPYYSGWETYQQVKDRLRLNGYEYSIEKAKAELVAGGWVYDRQGNAYDEKTGGVRYKKLQGYEKSYQNLSYSSKDKRYRTEYVGGEYYMPLVINWMGTQPNPVTDQLITAWQHNPSAGAKIGAYITYSSADFNGAVYGEYCQMPSYGFRSATYGAVNFATGFTSAVYDQSFSWSISPQDFAVKSSNFLRDEADFYSAYHAQETGW